ncbi:D-2-hydroxyacid dehydrogenase [Marinicrinis lubricantis]|uniref:D-2-hydroxyacid dehydrogenase n=1 Tax=Marinicrinis lubricantis TaxID=2086470 RepID=A0ABW1IJJ5_9BACL
MGTIICLPEFNSAQQARIRESAQGWNVIFARPQQLDEGTFGEAEIICGWSRSAEKEALAAESKLRWVQSWSAGVDKLPLDALQRKGVYITDASGVHPVQMTETVFAMMLAFTRNVHFSVRRQQSVKWDKSATYSELRHQSLGIVGAGEIGVEVARIGKAFGMKTLGVRRSGQKQPYVDQMFDMNGMEQVLMQSDFVVNILPLTEETQNLFREEQFALMKKTAYFINVGRGPSVHTAALTAALQSGQIAGAGLDVTDPEPLPEGHPLWKMDNVIITPHIGGLSEHYHERATDIFIENLQAYIQNRIPSRNVVDYDKKY